MKRLFLAVGVLGTMLLTGLAPATALAGTYTVGTTADPSSTACPSATETDCSLRQLILYIEAHPAAPDTIDVPAGTYTLNPAYGQLLITTNLTIAGAGAQATTIAEPVPTNRSSAGDRVFDISAPSGGSVPTVALEGMEIAGGDANSVNGNFGGDVVSSGTTTLSDDWVTNGFACSGAGVSNAGGTLTIERSLISANQAACAPGGDDSGGIQNYGEPGTPDLPGRLTVDDSTIAGNAARLGAGIYSWNDASNTVSITNSTIAGNTEQAEGGNAARGGGGGLGIATGTAQIENTILAANTSTVGGSAAASNCAGTVTSLGHNLEDANTCAFTGPGDLPSTNPALGPLQNNGGPTATLALTAPSPALAQVPAASCSPTDQRGVARPTTSSCDIGAFELTTGSSGTSTSSTGTTTASSSTPPTSSTPAPASTPASFKVGSATAGGVVLDATAPTGGDAVSRYQWTFNGDKPIDCPVSEPILSFSSSAPVVENVTLGAYSASGSAVSTTTNRVSISSRLHALRRPAASAGAVFAGECHGPVALPVLPLAPTLPKVSAKPPHGSSGGAPPPQCTDDLNFGAVDLHGCLDEVPAPQSLPGGITSELGHLLCQANPAEYCLSQLGDVARNLVPLDRSSAALNGPTTGALEAAGAQSLTQAGLPSYYSYSSVRMDGIDIVPQGGTPILVVPAANAIAASSVELYLDGVQLTPSPIFLSLDVPASGGFLGTLELPDGGFPFIKLLPFTGAIAVYLHAPGTTLSDGTRCVYACSSMNVTATLPKEFTDAAGHLVSGDGDVIADDVNGLQLSSLDIKVPWAGFDGVGVSDVEFRYQSANDLLYAQATLDLFPGYGYLRATLEFTNGDFREGSLDWDAGDGTGIDLGGPFNIYLVHLGVGILLDPTVITGNAKITGGPQVFGESLVSASGTVALGFTPLTVNLQGAGDLLGQNVAHVSLEYGDGYFDIGGAVTLGFGPLSLQAAVDLAVDAPQGHFQFDGDVAGCLDLYFFSGCVDAEGVVSDKGAGICADLGFTHAGGGLVYPDHLHIFFDTCDIQTFRSLPKDYRPAVRSSNGFGALTAPIATVPDDTFTVPHGQKVAVIGVVGQGNAPMVRLIGPGGRTIDTPADDFVKTPEDVVIADGKSSHTTYFFINHPQAGTWKVAADLGSVPIVAIHQATTLPDPDVHGQLQPLSGGRERLRYRLHPLAGQTVTFEEQAGTHGYDVVGHAHGASGTITFSPSLEMARARTLVAMVTQDGHARSEPTLAHFRAPLPEPLAAPRGLHGHRANTTVTLTWRPVPGSSSYQVKVTAGNGHVRHFSTDTPQSTVGGLPTGTAVVVSVTARRQSPWAGAPGRPAVVHLAAEKPVVHKVKLVRAT